MMRNYKSCAIKQENPFCTALLSTSPHAIQTTHVEIVFRTASRANGMYDKEYQVIAKDWIIMQSSASPALCNWKLDIRNIKFYCFGLDFKTCVMRRRFTYHDSGNQRHYKRYHDDNRCKNPCLGEHVLHLLEWTHQEAGTVPNTKMIQLECARNFHFWDFVFLTWPSKWCFRMCRTMRIGWVQDAGTNTAIPATWKLFRRRNKCKSP